jgi:hypothetical protein
MTGTTFTGLFLLGGCSFPPLWGETVVVPNVWETEFAGVGVVMALPAVGTGAVCGTAVAPKVCKWWASIMSPTAPDLSNIK